MNAFFALWLHRWRKYSEIAATYLRFWWTWLWIKGLKIKTPRRKVIGILLAEHFGDIVATEPLMRQIRRLHPNDRIYWIVRKPFRELVEFHPDLDGVIEEPTVLFSCLLNDNHVFDTLYFPYLSTRFYAYTGRKLINPIADRLGITVFNYFDYGNILEVFGKCAGLPPLAEAPRVYIQPKHVSRVDALNLPKHFVALHCHSNYAPKDWQIAHWQRLVREIRANFPFDVVEIGLRSSLQITQPGYVNLCGQLSLLETAEVIRRASFFIGVDSGPAHLANAVGTFGFVLLGRLNNLLDYMPYSGAYQSGEKAKLIRKGDLPCSEMSFEDVWQPISEVLNRATSPEKP